jgi:hypothetical protein
LNGVNASYSNNEYEINKWLNKNDKPSSNKAETTDTTTSIWLEDSKTNNNNKNNYESDLSEENMNTSNNGSKIQENNDILLQIRRIMGNLELSDIEDDNIENQLINTNRNNTSQDDLEHVIDNSNLTN